MQIDVDDDDGRGDDGYGICVDHGDDDDGDDDDANDDHDYDDKLDQVQ